jgi:hypothetical protein
MDQLETKIARLERELEEYDMLFAIQETRMQDATEAWQKEHNSESLPDLGKLLKWLLEKANL